MIRKKRLLILATAIILSLITVFAIGCASPASLEAGDFSEVLNRELPTLMTDDKGDFTILQLSDVHLFGKEKNNDIKTLEAIDSLLEKESYDLVVVTGDMLEGYNKKSYYDKAGAISGIADIFEKHSQYWAYVAGNNDGEYCGDNKAVFSTLVKYEHCLVSDVGVDGVGNYKIDINDTSGKLVHTLIMIDSGMRDENGKLVKIQYSQTKWYTDTAVALKNAEIKTSIFMHIPTYDFVDAFRHGEIYKAYPAILGYPDILPTDGSPDFYSAVKSMGNNGLIATGHTHANNFVSFYNDMYYMQQIACGYNAWNADHSRGGGKITIHTTADNLKDSYSFKWIGFDK